MKISCVQVEPHLIGAKISLCKYCHLFIPAIFSCCPGHMADSKLAPNQWETVLQNNTVSHWLGANLEYALSYNFDFLPAIHFVACSTSSLEVGVAANHIHGVCVWTAVCPIIHAWIWWGSHTSLPNHITRTTSIYLVPCGKCLTIRSHRNNEEFVFVELTNCFEFWQVILTQCCSCKAQ